MRHDRVSSAGDFSVAHESAPLPCKCAHSVLTENFPCRTPGLRPADVLFRLFDKDESGSISPEEFYEGVVRAWKGRKHTRSDSSRSSSGRAGPVTGSQVSQRSLICSEFSPVHEFGVRSMHTRAHWSG